MWVIGHVFFVFVFVVATKDVKLCWCCKNINATLRAVFTLSTVWWYFSFWKVPSFESNGSLAIRYLSELPWFQWTTTNTWKNMCALFIFISPLKNVKSKIKWVVRVTGHIHVQKKFWNYSFSSSLHPFSEMLSLTRVAGMLELISVGCQPNEDDLSLSYFFFFCFMKNWHLNKECFTSTVWKLLLFLKKKKKTILPFFIGFCYCSIAIPFLKMGILFNAI